MTSPFVADCSIAIGWVHPGQSTALTKKLLLEARDGAAIHVPALWRLEVANTLLVAVRRKLLTEPERQSGLALLSQLRLIIDDETSRMAFSAISEIAFQLSLSAYDAAYLELARRKSLPLATRDESLKRATLKLGVKSL